MITMYCQACRKPQEIDEHATAAFDRDALAKHLTGCRCGACGSGLTIQQIEVAIQVAEEHWEAERDADGMYWMQYLMGGYRRGLH